MMTKISFLGDIMCEGPFLNAAKKSDGTYCFDGVFDGVSQILKESDFIVGNLETPLAGPKAGYTKERDMYSFNTPDSFLRPLQEIGVDLFLTANNHCMDRGVSGLLRTLNLLDEKGFIHTGCYTSEENSKPFCGEIGNNKITIISCTASTNATITGKRPSVQNINLLDVEDCSIIHKSGLMAAIRAFISSKIIGRYRLIKIKKKLGKPYNKAYMDNYLNKERADNYIDRVCGQILAAKKEGSFVIVCPHMGGQFNVVPGKFSEYVMTRLCDAGADMVIASHAHILQKFERKNNVPCFYSIGNFSMSMSTEYLIKDDLPEYGIIVHLYIDAGQINKVAVTIIKILEDKDGLISVIPVHELIDSLEEKEKITVELNHIFSLLNINQKIDIDNFPKEIQLV